MSPFGGMKHVALERVDALDIREFGYVQTSDSGYEHPRIDQLRDDLSASPFALDGDCVSLFDGVPVAPNEFGIELNMPP